MGSAPATGAVFRALAENLRRAELLDKSTGRRSANVLDARARPATPVAGVLPSFGNRDQRHTVRIVMKAARKLILLVVVAFFSFSLVSSGQAAEKIRLLVMTGGHDFDTNQFFQVFKDNPDVTFEAVTHPQALVKLRPESAKNYDVLVLYDLWQKIDDQGKADFVNFLKSGKGLVVLHHAIANYQEWPEYEKIVGGRYYLQKTLVKGVEKPRSIWKHGVDYTIHIADPNHPVTRGVKDFETHDETYGLFDMGPESHPLLTADEPTSAKNIGWAKTYHGARVVFIQLGHDHIAYANPNYRKLVAQAIRWVAHQD